MKILSVLIIFLIPQMGVGASKPCDESSRCFMGVGSSKPCGDSLRRSTSEDSPVSIVETRPSSSPNSSATKSDEASFLAGRHFSSPQKRNRSYVASPRSDDRLASSRKIRRRSYVKCRRKLFLFGYIHSGIKETQTFYEFILDRLRAPGSKKEISVLLEGWTYGDDLSLDETVFRDARSLDIGNFYKRFLVSYRSAPVAAASSAADDGQNGQKRIFLSSSDSDSLTRDGFFRQHLRVLSRSFLGIKPAFGLYCEVISLVERGGSIGLRNFRTRFIENKGNQSLVSSELMRREGVSSKKEYLGRVFDLYQLMHDTMKLYCQELGAGRVELLLRFKGWESRTSLSIKAHHVDAADASSDRSHYTTLMGTINRAMCASLRKHFLSPSRQDDQERVKQKVAFKAGDSLACSEAGDPLAACSDSSRTCSSLEPSCIPPQYGCYATYFWCWTCGKVYDSSQSLGDHFTASEGCAREFCRLQARFLDQNRSFFGEVVEGFTSDTIVRMGLFHMPAYDTITLFNFLVPQLESMGIGSSEEISAICGIKDLASKHKTILHFFKKHGYLGHLPLSTLEISSLLDTLKSRLGIDSCFVVTKDQASQLGCCDESDDEDDEDDECDDRSI